MFQTWKSKNKMTIFRSNHHQRKLHHVHMAVTDIRWSDNIYGIKEVINQYNLPLLVKVTQGHFSGPDEDSLSQGQVSLICISCEIGAGRGWDLATRRKQLSTEGLQRDLVGDVRIGRISAFELVIALS